MKRGMYRESQIIKILKEGESGMVVYFYETPGLSSDDNSGFIQLFD